MKALLNRKVAWLALLVVAGIAGITWWQKTPILAWHYVREMSCADEDSREDCARRVAELEGAAVPRLLDGMHNPDPIVCANLQYPLLLIARNWSVADPRTQELVEQFHGQFAQFSPAGQEKTLLLLIGILQQEGPRPLPPRMTKTVGAILIVAEKNSELRSASLLLAAELVVSVQPGQWVDVCRALAEHGIIDQRANCRVAALQLLMRAPMRQEKVLLEKSIPLLRDSAPAVRKAALLVLASESDVVREDSFLPLLHDEDFEIQYLCQNALRSRGLSDDDLKLARMISDPSPATRLHVLFHLHRVPDLNLREWLQRLCQDSSPAVRAAAVRAAAEYPQVDLSARLREMAVADPNDAVRLNAQYFLTQRARRAALASQE